MAYMNSTRWRKVRMSDSEVMAYPDPLSLLEDLQRFFDLTVEYGDRVEINRAIERVIRLRAVDIQLLGQARDAAHLADSELEGMDSLYRDIRASSTACGIGFDDLPGTFAGISEEQADALLARLRILEAASAYPKCRTYRKKYLQAIRKLIAYLEYLVAKLAGDSLAEALEGLSGDSGRAGSGAPASMCAAG